jgi:hypothetical protein
MVLRGRFGNFGSVNVGSVAGINPHAFELDTVDTLLKNLGFNVVGHF